MFLPAECAERAFQNVKAFGEMCPAFRVHRDDACIRERTCSIKSIVRAHGKVERPARSRGAGKNDDDAGAKTSRNLRNPFVENGVAGEIHSVARLFHPKREARYLAGNRLDSGRSVSALSSIAGPRNFVSVIVPDAYSPGGLKVGSVSKRSSPYSSKSVGPPISVSRKVSARA